jgi:hypothetical protein
MINLITTFYISTNFYRNNELRKCLDLNLENPLIEKIHLYLDDDNALNYVTELNNNKINIISVGKKPLYSDLFGYGINELNGKICLVSNADIFLYECNLDVLNKLNEPGVVIALTRYEHDLSCPLIREYRGSHDCFMFKSPLNTDILQHIQHVQHHWNSEGVVLFELNRIGAKLYNPCHQIKIVHLHASNEREPNRIRYSNERGFLLPPCTL